MRYILVRLTETATCPTRDRVRSGMVELHFATLGWARLQILRVRRLPVVHIGKDRKDEK